MISLMNNMQPQPAVPAVVKSEPVTTQPSKYNILACLRGDIVDLTNDATPTSNEMELERYISERVAIEDLLLWWKQNENNFPNLAKLAMKYLAIPAMEIPSERAFSIAGLTVSKLRASLNPDNVDKLIFLHKNFKFAANNVCEPHEASAETTSTKTTTTAAPAAAIAIKQEAPGPSQAMDVQPALPSLTSGDDDLDY